MTAFFMNKKYCLLQKPSCCNWIKTQKLLTPYLYQIFNTLRLHPVWWENHAFWANYFEKNFLRNNLGLSASIILRTRLSKKTDFLTVYAKCCSECLCLSNLSCNMTKFCANLLSDTRKTFFKRHLSFYRSIILA